MYSLFFTRPILVTRAVLTPREPSTPSMTDAEHAEALVLLCAPNLLPRIVADFDACGVVDEGHQQASRLLRRRESKGTSTPIF